MMKVRHQLILYLTVQFFKEGKQLTNETALPDWMITNEMRLDLLFIKATCFKPWSVPDT